MPRVEAAVVVLGEPVEAEALWYDIGRWPAFVDGFGHVAKRDEEWPAAGATLAWDSTPHGRGRVLEVVSAHEPGAGQTATVEEERLRGTQRVVFEPAGQPGATRVTLALDYELKERRPWTPLVDLLFVRRALRESLVRTLQRFERERRADAEQWSQS